MRKLYLGLFILLVSGYIDVQAQVAGNTCTDPLVAQLCGAGPIASYIDTFSYHYAYPGTTVTIGNKNYTEYGYDVYYQVNLPTSSYNPVSLSASLVGNFLNYSNYSTQIYFFWYEGSPCTSNPTAVDSVIISGTTSIYDSLTIFYPVQSVQSQYYLVIAFQNADNYQYSLQFGYNNSEPLPTPICSPAPPPYKGTMTLDQSKCYTASNPYDLPLNYLLANPGYNNVFYPLTLNQNTSYYPISDGNGNGYIISLMRTDANNLQSFTSFDQFPYTYSNGNYDSYYSLGITVFFKNNGGAAGLKGFKMRMPGGYSYDNNAFPNGAGFYDPTGNWDVSYDGNTYTYTWLFIGNYGRGDNTNNNGYSCEVYTFTGQFNSLGDTLQAWYLSDNYGNDSTNCVYGASNPPRTDCGPLLSNYNNNDWVQFIGNGNGGSGAEGQACGSVSNCNAGIEFYGSYDYLTGTNCTDYLTYGSTCGINFLGTNPFITYDSLGCATETDPEWNSEFPDFTFGASSLNGVINAGICNGQPYKLMLSGNACYSQFYTPSYLVYQDDSGSQFHLRPVDSLGNIEYNIDLQDSFNMSVLPVYPCNSNYSFTIPLSRPGTYYMYYTVYGYNYYYNKYEYQPEVNCGSTLSLVLVNDSNPKISFSPASDTTICAGNSFDVMEYGATTFEWLPDTGVENNYPGEAEIYPRGSIVYTVTGTDIYGCTDTANYVVKVQVCPPRAFFENQISCGFTCSTYYDESSNEPTQWQWTFPQGNPSSYSGQNPPQVCYPDTGVYTVKLVVSNSGGIDSIVKSVIVGICTPVASFAANNTTICNTGCVTFYNHSFNGSEYYWTFPGGNPSYFDDYDFNDNNDSIMVCYADTGTYHASIIVSNYYYGDQDTFSLPIQVLNCHPVAQFSSPDTTCKAQCVTYTNTSLGNPSSWQWSFEGGTPASYNGQTPPVICYNTNGTYSITLIVSSNSDSDTTSKTIVVTNCSTHPTASFTAVDSVCRTGCITYTNTSSFNATSWAWSFPGGSPSSYSGQNPPTICYDTIGVYGAILITSNSYGSDTFISTLIVYNCSPHGHFRLNDTICQSDCITLDSLSFSNITSWQWLFGGGTPSSYNGPIPPSVCFDTIGTFAIQLIAGNKYGVDTFVANLTVQNCKPIVSLALPDTICAGNCVSIIKDTAIHITSWNWQFPGGTPSSFKGAAPHICYDSSGSYPVTLIVSNTYGSDTLYVPGYIFVTPLPELSIKENEDTLISTPEVSYQWFFNNTPISGATNQTLIISQDGSYTIGVTGHSVCSEFYTISVSNLGVNSVSAGTEFTISPNPSDGVFHIQVPASLSDGTIEVYNILGERVVISNIKNQISNSFTMDLSNQPDGVYFVRLQTGNGMAMKKVVVGR